jgi:hypothetical protein
MNSGDAFCGDLNFTNSAGLCSNLGRIFGTLGAFLP